MNAVVLLAAGLAAAEPAQDTEAEATVPEAEGPSEEEARPLPAPRADPGGRYTVWVRIHEHRLEPSRVVVPEGARVRLLVENAGNVPHQLSIAELGHGTDVLQPGETQLVTFVAEPGSWTLGCQVADHPAAEAALVVRPAEPVGDARGVVDAPTGPGPD